MQHCAESEQNFFALPPLSLAAVQNLIVEPQINRKTGRQQTIPQKSALCYLFLFNNEAQLGCCCDADDLLQQLPRLSWEIFKVGDQNPFLTELRVFAFLGSQALGWEELLLHKSNIVLCAFAEAVTKLLGAEQSLIRSWKGFRSIIPLIPEWQQGLLARARELCYFEREFRFCSRCASKLNDLKRELGKVCPNCSELYFPRQDPSIIALICHRSQNQKEWLLLGHNYRFHNGLYSLIAGFVEAGETPEQALQRESWEEAGVHLESLQYLCSQAWPQPHSLMNGFLAYSTVPPEQSRPDGTEIAELLWLERRDIQSYLHAEKSLQNGALYPIAKCREFYIYKRVRNARQATGFRLPERGTIARKLIEKWALHKTMRMR